MGVNRAKLAAQLKCDSTLCLDSAILIYHLEAIEPYVDLTEEIVARVASGELRAVISTVTIMELLVKPFAEGHADRIVEFENFLHTFPNLQILSLGEAIAKEAARLRGHYRLKTPDALIAATGLTATADILITNDSKWDRLKAEGVAVIGLDSFLKT